MNYWSEYPFVRILFAFLGGIVLYIFTQFHFPAWILTASILSTLLLHLFIRKKMARLYKYASVIGFSFQLSIFFFGNILTYEKTDQNRPEHFIHRIGSANYFVVKIKEPLIEKEKSFKAVGEIVEAWNHAGRQKSFGNTILYLYKDSAAKHIRYGDLILLKNNFKPVAGPKNPDEFNYRNYLWYREIYATAYLKAGDWKIVSRQSINPVYQLTYHLRDLSLAAIQKYIPGKREAAVAEALIIGYRDDMSSDIMQSYTAAGVVHVLAVSGLHVGILFAMLHQLLFFLNRKKRGKIVQSVIIITIIWMFALLTGLSGSVIRSAAMFSFITLGQNLKRSVNMNNTLACSAVSILLFNPLMIMDVGFQLSYFAVFGISALSKYFDNLLERENKIIDHVWKTISMSMAAQLVTLPLTLFYFNQFPTYFLLANLVVIPAAGIILHLGIILIIVQFISPLAILVGKLTGAITYFMNEFIRNIQLMPHSVIHLQYMLLIQAILLGFVILLLSRFFISSQKKWLFLALTASLFFAGIQSLNIFYERSRRTITIYSLKDKTNLEFRNGDKAILFQNGLPLSTTESYFLQKHWQLKNISYALKSLMKDSSCSYLDRHLYRETGLFQFYDYRIAIIHKPINPNEQPHRIKVDAAIVCSNPSLKIDDVIKMYDAKTIVLDSDNTSYQIRRWKNQAEALGIKVYDVNAEGAFIINL